LLIALFMRNNGYRGFGIRIYFGIRMGIGKLWEAFSKALLIGANALAKPWQSLGKALAKPWQSLGKALAKLWQSLGKALAKPWQSIGKALVGVCNALVKPWQSLGKALAKP
jgi:hypothetical protein